MSTIAVAPVRANDSTTAENSSYVLPPISRLAGLATRNFPKENGQPAQPPQEGIRSNQIFEVMMDWEGVVEEVNADGFVARLLDRRSSSKLDTEAADIPFSEVNPDDVPLVRPGAIFYLTVYRVIASSGQQQRSTRLFFRRLPAWTPALLASARNRADRWKKRFGVAENNFSSE
jgi:hypothetical protein